MKLLAIFVLLAATLFTGCGNSAPSTSGQTRAAKKFPLECSSCDYIEDTGRRSLVGNVWNGSNKTHDLVVDIEEKDATGKIVDKIYNLSLFNRSLVHANHSVPIHQALIRRAGITHITFYFREPGINDVKATLEQMLSPAYTRKLHTLPVPPDVIIPDPEP